MHRDALTELGESLRDDLRDSLGISENGSDLADLNQDIQRLWERVVQQFEALSARLGSAAALDDLPEPGAPVSADDVSGPDKQPADRPAASPDVIASKPPRASGADIHPESDPARPVFPAEHPSDAYPTFRPEPPAVASQPQHRTEAAASSAPDARPDPFTSQEERPLPSRGLAPESSVSGEDFTRPDITLPASPRPLRPRSADGQPAQPEPSTGSAPMPPAIPARAVARETAGTQLPPERMGGSSQPPDVYKPLRGLQDLAQLLSAGPYREDAPPPDAGKPSPTARPAEPASREIASAQPVRDWDRDAGREERPPQADDNGGVAVSMSSQVAEAASEPDVETLLDALSRSLAEEYKRFYGS